MDEERKYLVFEKVLDHGFVELIDILGTDQAIVDAARTSYDKGTTKVSSTEQLLRYLMRHKHMGPFEFGECVFRIRCPLFVARQWFRHRTASYNETSLRYSEAIDEYYVPPADWITSQDSRNRQARTSEQVIDSDMIRRQFDETAHLLLEKYKDIISHGVAREIARITLPLSLYTTFCFKIDLRNLMNFLSLRTDPHAQFEIRLYAESIEKMVEKYFPLTIRAWRDYNKNSITFSVHEMHILKEIIKGKLNLLSEIDLYYKKHPDLTELDKLEKQEFSDKILLLLGNSVVLDYLGKTKT